MLFWLLSFWNKFWNCEVCSSKFDFLFQSCFSYLDPRSSIWIWGLAFPFQKKRAIGISIGIGLYLICRSLWGSIDILMFSLLVLSIPWIFDRIFLENSLDLWGFFFLVFIHRQISNSDSTPFIVIITMSSNTWTWAIFPFI